MYLLDLEYVNAGLNGSGRFSLSRGSGTVGKWTLLAGDELHQELLRLTVLSCTSPAFFPGLSFPMGTLRGAQEGPLRVGNLRVLHEGVDTAPGKGMKVTGGVRVGGRGEVHSLSRAGRDSFFGDVAFRMHSIKAALCRDFILAYGSDFTAHEGDDDFDFLDPLFRCRRFRSLFSGSAPLTDPVAFLESLFHRGAKQAASAPADPPEDLRAAAQVFWPRASSLAGEPRCGKRGMAWSPRRDAQAAPARA